MRTRLLLAALAVALAAVSTAALWLTGHHTTHPHATPSPPTAEAPPGPPHDPATQQPTPSTVAPGPSTPDSTVTVTGAPSATSSPSPGKPGPHIVGFPADSTRTPQHLPGHSAPAPVPATIDGCDRDYGTAAQCIPLVLPPGITDRCAWLRAQGYLPLTVTGRDTLRLDPDGDHLACD
jgi:hypothetical protein